MVNRACVTASGRIGPRRFTYLANSALCSAAVAATVMQISVARADTNLRHFFTAAPDVVIGTGSVTDNKFVAKMKAGDDRLRLGKPAIPFTGTFSDTAIINGGAGTDTLQVFSGSSLTVTKLTTFNQLENVQTGGTINANGGLSHNGSAGADIFNYTGAGKINVTGNLNVSTLGGNDRLTITNTKISVSGGTATFDGGAGPGDVFRNDGHVATTSGNVEIEHFETVSNSGSSFDVDGNFSASGMTVFANSGKLTAKDGTFGFKGSGDSFVNSAAGEITLSGAGEIHMLGGDDTVRNAGSMSAASWLIGSGAGGDTFTNSGSVTAGSSVTVAGFGSVANGAAGLIQAGTAFSYTGTAGADTFTNAGQIEAATGASFDFLGGSDTLNNRAGATIEVTGGTATFDGGAGPGDVFRNDGHVATTSGNVEIEHFETVSNSGSSFDVDGNFSASGMTVFANSGKLTAKDGTFGFKGSGDRFVNSAAGEITLSGAGAIHMLGGDDTVRNAGSMSAASWLIGGGAGGDTFTNSGSVTAGSSVTVAGFGSVANGAAGLIQAGTAFSYTGTAGADTFTNAGQIEAATGASFDFLGGSDTLNNRAGATIEVTGGKADFLMGNGNDTLNNRAGATIQVTGGTATFDGGAGPGDVFRNDGHVATTSGNVEIEHFETVSNSGSSFDVDGNFSASGMTVFANSGKLTAKDGTFGFKGSGDRFVNSAAGEITLSGAGAIHMLGGDDTVRNAGSMSAASWLIGGGAGGDTFTNSGSVTAGSSVTVAGFGSVANGAAGLIQAGTAFSYTGTAGADTFTNAGQIEAATGASFDFLGGSDTLNNRAGATIEVTGGTATFDGGAGPGDVFRNDGHVATTSGNVEIEHFETVSNSGSSFDVDGNFSASGMNRFTNSGTLTAKDGTFGFKGSGDRFVNSAAGEITLSGAGEIHMLGGDDTMRNAGSMSAASWLIGGGAGGDTVINAGQIEAATGAAFDLGGGNDTLNNRAGATITVTGGKADFLMGNGDDTLNNRAGATIQVVGDDSAVVAATFDGGAGADDAFKNRGSIIVKNDKSADGGGIVIKKFETVTNGGTLDIQDGGFANHITAGKLNSVAGNVVKMDTQLTEGGKSDLLSVGKVSGTTNLNLALATDGAKTLITGNGGKLEVVSNDTSGARRFKVNGYGLIPEGSGNTDGINLSNKIGGDFDGGFVDYWIRNNKGDVYIQSTVDGAKAGAVTSGVGAAINSISTLFQKPITAFISRCKENDPDGTGYGVWGRASGGQFTSDAGGSYSWLNGEGAISSKNRTDYLGLQSGLDAASCDQGNGRTYHAGLMGGYLNGSSQQLNGNAADRMSVDFDTKFIGAYAAMFAETGPGVLAANATVRYDAHLFDVDQADIVKSGKRAGQSVDGHSLSGIIDLSYSVPVSDTVVVIPSGGFTITKTSVDRILTDNGNLSFKDQLSAFGSANLTVRKTVELENDQALHFSLTGSLFYDFGDDPQASIDIGKSNKPDQIVTTRISNSGLFSQIGALVTWTKQGSATLSDPDMVGTLRFDAQFGEHIEGWGLTGQLRLQF